MSTFRRGFKSWCETASAQFRVVLGLRPSDPLLATRLARHIGATVVNPRDLRKLSASALKQLVERDSDSWSAVTVSALGRDVIVVNPMHSAGRAANDLMHECAHLILKHRPAKAAMSADGQLLMSAYDRQQEDEANWLAATLLLPRSALLSIAASGGIGGDLAASARAYGVSESLLRMRLNVTGVRFQLGRRSA